MEDQRQVKLSSVARYREVPFFHRKVGRRGATRSLSVGKILPTDWYLVKVRVIKLEGKTCLLEITKLD